MCTCMCAAIVCQCMCVSFSDKGQEERRITLMKMCINIVILLALDIVHEEMRIIQVTV